MEKYFRYDILHENTGDYNEIHSTKISVETQVKSLSFASY